MVPTFVYKDQLLLHFVVSEHISGAGIRDLFKLLLAHFRKLLLVHRYLWYVLKYSHRNWIPFGMIFPDAFDSIALEINFLIFTKFYDRNSSFGLVHYRLIQTWRYVQIFYNIYVVKNEVLRCDQPRFLRSVLHSQRESGRAIAAELSLDRGFAFTVIFLREIVDIL